MAVAIFFLCLAGIWFLARFALRRPPSAPTPAEAAWWKMDEQTGSLIEDSSGHGLSGQVTGGDRTPGVLGEPCDSTVSTSGPRVWTERAFCPRALRQEHGGLG